MDSLDHDDLLRRVAGTGVRRYGPTQDADCGSRNQRTLRSGLRTGAYFVLAITGTMRATRTARAKLNLGRGDWSGEELDTSPNALDLAFYTTTKTPKGISVVSHFSYVAFLALGLYEAAGIAKQLWDAEAPTSYLFLILGAMLWLPAVGFVVHEFLRRVQDVPTLWRTK